MTASVTALHRDKPITHARAIQAAELAAGRPCVVHYSRGLTRVLFEQREDVARAAIAWQGFTRTDTYVWVDAEAGTRFEWRGDANG